MSDPSEALQDAIEAALRASPALLAAMGGDRVRLYTLSAPAGATYPYVVIGEDQISDDATACAASSEAFTTVHAWARPDGAVQDARIQAKRMAAAVRDALVALPGVAGFDLVLAEFETTRHLTDPDGLTAHSVISHRFLLDPA